MTWSLPQLKTILLNNEPNFNELFLSVVSLCQSEPEDVDNIVKEAIEFIKENFAKSLEKYSFLESLPEVILKVNF
jgi:hypothetical protein